MDILKAEIAAKRKAVEVDTDRPKKYMRKGDIERMRLEEEQRAREEKERAAREKEEQESQAKVRSIAVTFAVGVGCIIKEDISRGSCAVCPTVWCLSRRVVQFNCYGSELEANIHASRFAFHSGN